MPMPQLYETQLKRDYPELIDELAIITYNDGPRYIGRVIACDYHVGMTIVDADDPNKYLLCQYGPLSQRARQNVGSYRIDRYTSRFAQVVEGIVKGEIFVDKIFALSYPGSPSSVTCPFNQ